MDQYEFFPEVKTIHSSLHMESFNNKVDDRSSNMTYGKQCIETIDGYVLPLRITNGFPYLKIISFTNNEWEFLHHMILTSYKYWDPYNLDKISKSDDVWYDTKYFFIDDSNEIINENRIFYGSEISVNWC